MSRLTAVPTAAARWSATHPWRAIGIWFAFVALAVALAVIVPVRGTTEADYRLGESGRAQAMLDDSGLTPASSEAVLITPRSGRLDPGAAQRAGAELRDAMARAPGVAGVADLIWSPDRSAALVTVDLREGTTDVAPLVALTQRVQAAHPDLEIRQAGDLSIEDGINERVGADLHRAEFISLPITLALMLLAFGALIAAGVPVLLAGTSVAATMGLAVPISYLLPAEPTTNSMIVLIGMAVGVDYSLFYLKREREERARGASTLDAVAIAARTSGHAVLVSGGAVIASLSGLFLVGGATYNSLAIGSIVVVAVAVLGSITVLPALLVKLGRWADRPRVPLLWRVNRRIGAGGISRRLLAPVVRRPRSALLLALVAAVGLSIPAAGMTLHGANLSTLPGDIPQVGTALRIGQEFPSQGAGSLVVVQAPAQRAGEIRTALLGLSESVQQHPGFRTWGLDPIAVSADGTVTRLSVAIKTAEEDPATDRAIELLRDELVPSALDGLGVSYAVGGAAATNLDSTNQQRDRLPWLIGFILILTLMIMWAAFRSTRLALLSAGLNLLSVGVAFGVMRLVFQDGHLESWLDFRSPGYVIEWIPVFVLAVLVGLSMDYHVFVLSRVQEYAVAGHTARDAVRLGIGDTAGVVTSAAAVMVSVFAVFASLSMLEMKMLGVGLATAILFDATVIRLVILPAALVLLGDRVWHTPAAQPQSAPRDRRRTRELIPS